MAALSRVYCERRDGRGRSDVWSGMAMECGVGAQYSESEAVAVRRSDRSRMAFEADRQWCIEMICSSSRISMHKRTPSKNSRAAEPRPRRQDPAPTVFGTADGSDEAGWDVW